MLRALALLPLMPLMTMLACSGDNFDLASAPGRDTGPGATMDDTAPSSNEDAIVDPSDTGSTTPACNEALPEPLCVAPGPDYYEPQFQYAGGAELTPILDRNTSHAISYVTEHAGRHRKLIVTLNRMISTTGTVAGRVTLEAFYTPCEGTNVPLGKFSSHDASSLTGGNATFYFDEQQLPVFPAGTRLTFVLSTDSTMYSFRLVGSPTGATPPSGLKWRIKKGATGDWVTPSAALPNASAWLYHCPPS